MSLLSRYGRSYMTRYMLAKLAESQNNSELEREMWYQIDVDHLQHDLQAKFIKCSIDDETEQFLVSCVEKSGFVFTQFFHSVAQIFLGFMLSTTTINGLLDRGKMFVFSSEQFKTLTGIEDACVNQTLLDLGAGDGMVTSVMAKYFRSVYVTESSSSMRYRLNQKGFTVMDINEWQNSRFDFISVLNLLDRVDNPTKLLNDVRLSLNPNGTVLLAIVLPYSPWVEQGSKFEEPSETLAISGKSAEQQIENLIYNVLEPAGFRVVRFTKLPYLCEGDLYDDYFLLFDYVFVLKTIDSS